jgi:hypothetical protein
MGGHSGGGMGGHGGMSGMGMGHGMGGRGMGMARGTGFAHGGPHVGRFAHGRHFAFRHGRFFRHRRFAFAGGFYDVCYTRVWTRWGWRWIYACYY